MELAVELARARSAMHKAHKRAERKAVRRVVFQPVLNRINRAEAVESFNDAALFFEVHHEQIKWRRLAEEARRTPSLLEGVWA